IAERDGFLLRWSAADKTADGYSIVRKAGMPPAHCDDGIWRRDVTDTVASDHDGAIGIPWHYAVFSRRDAVCSSAAARSGPHLRVAPVDDVVVATDDGEVTLTWSLPNGASGVEVWRGAGAAPAQAGLGERMRTGKASLRDGGLVNDATVGYLIVPLFPDPRQPGGLIRGPGTACLATPTQPPPA